MTLHAASALTVMATALPQTCSMIKDEKPSATDAGHLRPRLLVVSDGGSAFRLPAHLREGCAVDETHDAAEAVALVQTHRPSVAIVEMRLHETSGLAVMEALHRLLPTLPVVLVTAHPTVAEAVHVMRAGAESYLPDTAEADLLRTVRGIIDCAWTRPRGETGRRLRAQAALPGLVGESEPMRAILEQIALVSPTRTNVLLLGETGTGKERIAQAIHASSPRRHGPFVAVNCAALAETILESELFGHEKGAFSGAHARREGRFKLADRGTIFLDEIGEISPSIQVKLLRVLQERQFERVGGNETISVDVRVIAATNRNLREMVAAKTFRADLFYRLNVVSLQVPALRDRRGDLPLLVDHILPRLAVDLGTPVPQVTARALHQLESYDWPGNVRELENVLERALVLNPGGTIERFDLPNAPTPLALVPAGPLPATSGPRVPGSTFREIERHAIISTYEACGRSPQRTAEVLGISPRTVHYRLREYRGEQGRRGASRPPEAAPHRNADRPLQIVHSVASGAGRAANES